MFKYIILSRIFLCNTDNGFNYEYAGSIGYEGLGEFLKGEINSLPGNVSWVGKNNTSWDEMKNMLFLDPEQDFEFRQTIEPNTTKIRMFPLRCFEVSNYTETMKVKSEKPLILYFSDPYRQPSFRLVKSAMAWDPLTLGYGKFPGESSYYQIDITITEKRQDVGACEVYQKPSDYEKCVDNSIMDKMMELLGCVPPWITFNVKDKESIICKEAIDLSNKNATEVLSSLDELNNDVKFLSDNGFQSAACKPSCTQMKVATQLTSYAAGNWNGYYMSLLFNKEVKITIEVNSYDIFRLCVEVGSSLGLWLGLSAIGLFQLMLTSLRKIQMRKGIQKNDPVEFTKKIIAFVQN